MSEVPDRNAASASAEASNPFAPIDYASRLKAPSRHTGAFHAMQPLQPGQLYGAAPWMSPPKPLASNPAPQESGEVPSGQGASSFSSAFPPYAYPSPTRPVSSGESAAGSQSGRVQRHRFSAPSFPGRDRRGTGGTVRCATRPAACVPPLPPQPDGASSGGGNPPPRRCGRRRSRRSPCGHSAASAGDAVRLFLPAVCPGCFFFAGNPAVSRGRQPRRALCAAVSARRALPARSCG